MPIIGVTGDAKNRNLVDPPRPELYVPALGSFANLALRTEIFLVARAGEGAGSLAGPIQQIVARLAPDAATYNIMSLGDIVEEAQSRMTTATTLITGYALAALLLAVAGTYAVLAYLVSQRRRELAIRVALGASPRAIVALVARESALMVGLGLLAGLLAALASARLLTGLLYGVTPLEPVVILLVMLGSFVVGFAAALLPARRAVRLDPGVALKAGG
jgi:ABC-type antimicrobial peptide transport system permease subunit